MLGGKIQTIILKQALKDKLENWIHQRTETAIYISDTFYICKIHPEAWFLDVNALGLKTNLDQEKLMHYENATKTLREVYQINDIVNGKKSVVQVFEDEEGEKYHVQEKFLKECEFTSDFIYKTEGKFKPIFVFKFDECVGLILPLRR